MKVCFKPDASLFLPKQFEEPVKMLQVAVYKGSNEHFSMKCVPSGSLMIKYSETIAI